MKWNWMSLYWLIWAVVGFGVPEGIALATGNARWTLSEQVWHLEGTGATFWRWTVCSMLLWLLFHMVFRLFR